jgi:hypothetical protein
MAEASKSNAKPVAFTARSRLCVSSWYRTQRIPKRMACMQNSSRSFVAHMKPDPLAMQPWQVRYMHLWDVHQAGVPPHGNTLPCVQLHGQCVK